MSRAVNLTDWSEPTNLAAPNAPVSLARYAMLTSYSERGRATVSGPSDARELPETGTTIQPGATLSWARRRKGITFNRDTVESLRRDRCYLRNHGTAKHPAYGRDGSDALQRELDARAYGVPGYGSLHIDQ